MNQNTIYWVEYHGPSDDINGSIGVKQGCNMSSLLSNTFQNYIHNENTCDPIQFRGRSISSLSLTIL